MDNKTRQALEVLNEQLKGQVPYSLELIPPGELHILDKNARYMTNEMFQNLVDNIKRDGNLSSLPLCLREDGVLKVLSGNHRVQAAVSAGIETVLVLVIDDELSRDEQVAIQLSHNAIAGKDDPVMLRSLWEEIKDIELKVYAGLDTETIRELESMEFDSIAEARLDFKIMTMLFLPEEVEKLTEVLAKADGLFSGDVAYTASREHYTRIFDVIVKAKEGYNIVNTPTALMKIVEIAEAHLDSLEPPEK